LNSEIIPIIRKKFPDLNMDWLLYDEGNMIGSGIPTVKRNLIPFYEDTSTIGGTNGVVADSDTPHSNTSLLIDAGDWFKDATAAIRHYEHSMVEYQSGCILALRELKDKSEIVWGRNYVVETDEMRVTKKIAEHDDDHIMAYSTNKETYPDGKLVHQPIKIKKESIRRISRVLGSVNKEENSGQVQIIR
jgi:hypothetical protein